MSSNKPIKGPGRGGAAFRSGPMVENPGKMLKRLLAYIVKNYRIHIILVVDFHPLAMAILRVAAFMPLV